MAVAHATGPAPPPVLAAAALAALLFAQGALRLRRRGRADLASWDRAALFAVGLAVSLAALVTPIDSLGEDELLSLHMLQHVLIGDLGVALMVVAVRGPLLVFLLPAPALATFACGQALTDVLVFAFHGLYPAYEGAYGISAHTDQQLAGVVMMVEQLLTLGTLVFVLLRPRLRPAHLATA